MSKVAYTTREAAEECGLGPSTITLAIRDGELIARWVGDKIIVPHYDLEMWLLSQDNYLTGLPSRMAEERERRAREEADRQAKSQERREAKAARERLKAEQAEEEAKVVADLAELDSLRQLTRN
jgi:hypothetical protein